MKTIKRFKEFYEGEDKIIYLDIDKDGNIIKKDMFSDFIPLFKSLAISTIYLSIITKGLKESKLL